MDNIDHLILGYQKFHQQYFEQDNALYQSLVIDGQRPKYLVVACSDSRVDPAIILNCKPGDLFVIRNVANLIPPCEFDSHYHGTSAALEFGICHLKIQHVIILGHSQCGGINNLLENYKNQKPKEPNSFLEKWIELAKPGCDQAILEYPNLKHSAQADVCARHSLLFSLENLKTFHWIQKGLELGTLFLHAWFFDLNTGKISFFNQSQQKFELLDNKIKI